MTALAAIALVLLMCARRRPDPDARTPAQMWASVRALGWQAVPIGLWRLAQTLAWAAAGLAHMLILGVIPSLRGLAVIAWALGRHLQDLIGCPAVEVVRA